MNNALVRRIHYWNVGWNSGHLINLNDGLPAGCRTVGCDVFYVIIETLFRMSYLLTTDATQISSISSMRVMVTAALLYAFTIHYLFVAIVYLFRSKVKVERIYDHGRRLVLYGIAALLSINFLNYGIYHAIMAWVTLVCVLILHCMAVISEVRENHQNIALAIYYILIGVWLFGILFFYMFNAMN